MSDAHYSVVVVGGGPAGSAAAQTLATAGVDVCVIDKAAFPRDKLCGGLVTTRSAKTLRRIFPASVMDSFEEQAVAADFCYAGTTLATAESRFPLHFVQRRVFDHALLQAAIRSGAKSLLDAQVKEVDAAARQVVLDDETRVSFDVLIGADGVNSSVARSLFGSSFNQETIGFGLEVELPRAETGKIVQRPEIHFGAANWGYAWVFPKRETYTIGIGGLHKRNPEMKSALIAFFEREFPGAAMPKIKGHFIPFGDYREKPGTDRILLCGDAAGLVDSITGEGIAFALESGEAAAQAVVASLRHKQPVFPIYLKAYKPLARHIRESDFYRNFIYPAWAKPLFVRLLPDAGTLQRGYLEILAGERTYDTMSGLLGLQAVKAVRKVFKRALGGT